MGSHPFPETQEGLYDPGEIEVQRVEGDVKADIVGNPVCHQYLKIQNEPKSEEK